MLRVNTGKSSIRSVSISTPGTGSKLWFSMRCVKSENGKSAAACGCCESGMPETGREAKFYELTARGRAQLKSETESWGRLTGVVALFLEDPQGEPS